MNDILKGIMLSINIFWYIYRSIIRRDLSDDEFRPLSDLFALLVFGDVVQTSFVLGAREFLQANHRKFSMYLVSVTPEDELLWIVREWGFGNFFRGVHGVQVRKTCLGDSGF